MLIYKIKENRVMSNKKEIKEKLIYDLIFSDIVEYEINVGDYITELYKYDRFIDEIKSVLLKSKVSIIKEKVSVEANSVSWKIKVKK